MATTDDIEQSLRSLMDGLDQADPPPGSIPDRTILCIVPDLGTAYRAEIRDARILEVEAADPKSHADVRITARSDDLIAMIQGRLPVGPALLMRRVRVDASPADLLLLRRFF
ncbi:MAG: alkyl sulfatase [Actinomycetota bacterium]